MIRARSANDQPPVKNRSMLSLPLSALGAAQKMSASSCPPLSSDKSGLTATTESSPASQDPHLRAIFDLAREQLQQCVQQRDEITNRIRTIKQTILGLANLYGDELLSGELHHLVGKTHRTTHSGFTNACRTVLRQAENALNAREVCSLLQQHYPNVLQHNHNLMAAVTTILNRLVKYGEARSFDGDGRGRVWQVIDRDVSSSWPRQVGLQDVQHED